MKNIYLLLLLILAGCVTLAPPVYREHEVIKSDLKDKKSILYERALIFWAKSIRTANLAIDIRDKENGKIVGKFNTDCKIRIMQINRENVSVVFDFTAKDGKYRLIFSDIVYRVYDQYGREYIHGPSNSGETAEIYQKCLKEIENNFHAHMAGMGSGAKDDF